MPGVSESSEKRAGGPPALSLVAIISLRRRDFLFDLDRRDIKGAIRQLRGTSNEYFQAWLEILFGAGNRGGDDGLRRHDELLLLIGLAQDLVLDRQHLAIDAGD